MASVRWIAGLGLGALVVTGTLLAPALRAQEGGIVAQAAAVRGVASVPAGFTPSAADPKLAALLARAGAASANFQFTPAEAGAGGEARAITTAAAIRPGAMGTGQSRIGRAGAEAAPARKTNLVPITYNLGMSKEWTRMAVVADVAKVDLGVKAAGNLRSDLGIGQAEAQGASPARRRPALRAVTAESPRLIGDGANDSLDVGGSFSLTRNLDVTAGVRYKAERDRLRMPELNDDRRGSQAVYVGTAFRF